MAPARPKQRKAGPYCTERGFTTRQRASIRGVVVQESVCALPDGSAVVVRGAPPTAGYPVVVHHGTPGSRQLFGPAVQQAADHGLRLISWDRPGYGDRPPTAGCTADIAAEALAVADGLGISQFATYGFSGGGSYALACAALLPERVAAAVVIAGLAPFDAADLDWCAHRADAARDEVQLFFTDRRSARERHRVDAEQYRQALSPPEGWLQRWGDAAGQDDAHGTALAEYLASVFHESLKNGDDGWWRDWSAALSPWGFSVRNIEVPVQLWYGDQDAAVGVEHGRWLAREIPDADAHILTGEDHTTIETGHQRDAWRWLQHVTAADPTA